ncbi:hypothetical protein [Caballeronia grimmiae]|uniref:hypothetical protein n=1 Tax=Caballeronia grimmiae TaxID=1071679 RepID=UPI0038B80DAD
MHDAIAVSTPTGFQLELANKYPLDSIREDITAVFVHYVRTIARVIGCDTTDVWHLPQMEFGIDNSDLWDPEKTPADLGITYEQIRHTLFARYMEVLYAFAVHGRVDISGSVEPMHYETEYTWIAEELLDAAEGHVAEEWDGYVTGSGAHSIGSANRCLKVVELANARCILENGEGFSYFRRRPKRDETTGRSKEDRPDLRSLTVGQLALLANMEEMSVRAATNPKRATRLETRSTPEGTRIAPDIAKAWLQAKGRYIPVVQYWSAGDVDLQSRRFKDPHDLLRALDQRRKALNARLETSTLDAALVDAGIQIETAFGEERLAEDVMARFDDPSCMTILAGLLELPAAWLVLRAREAATLARLAEVERELKVLSQPPGDVQDVQD